MRHPSGYYVKYLLAAAWGDDEHALDLVGVNQSLLDFGLPEMSDTQFEYLRSLFQAPDNFKFSNQTHKQTVDFMTAERIHSIWKPNAEMQRVFNEMLGDDNRRFQQSLHILLMGDVPHEIIAARVSEKFKLTKTLTPTMIGYYRHYFWRVQSMTNKEWREFLSMDQDADLYMSALLCGTKQALFRAGFNPSFDPKTALRDTHRQVTFRLQYLGYQSDFKTVNDTVIKLSREQRSLYDVLHGEGSGTEEQYKEVQRFLMKHNIRPPDSFQKLGDKLSISNNGQEGNTGKKIEGKKLPQKENDDDSDANA